MSSPTSDMPSPTSDMPSPTGDMPSPTSQTPPVPPEVEPRKLVKISPIMVRLKPNPDADPPFGFCLDSESKICLIVGVVHCEMSIPEMEHLTTISCVEGVKTANAQKPEVYLESLIQHMGVPSFETGGGPRTKVFRKVLSTAVPYLAATCTARLFHSVSNADDNKIMSYHDLITKFLKRQGVPHRCRLCSKLPRPECTPLSDTIITEGGGRLPRVSEAK